MTKKNQGFVLATTIKTLRRSADTTQHTAANLLTTQDKKIKELEAFKASVLDNLKQQAEDNKAAAALREKLEAHLPEIRDALGDDTLSSISQVATGIRDLREKLEEAEAQSLDDTTRTVLDRAERIVAGQSPQEQRNTEIFLRPTE